MMSKRWFYSAILTIALLGTGSQVHAALITSTLGNISPGFSDGDIVPTFIVGGAQTGSPAPFDQSYGTDGLFGGDFSASWTHNYGVITDTILSATISFGIYDHDSSASGDQLSSFLFAGLDLTSSLNPLFEAPLEGLDSQYDVYSLGLDSSSFADIADGSVDAVLDLMGNGLVADLFGGGFSETATNGANLIFASLEITTEDPSVIPEPSILGMLLFGLFIIGWQRRRVL